jgi:hypothetical protein
MYHKYLKVSATHKDRGSNVKAKHDTADQQKPRPMGRDDVAPVGGRSAFLAWTLSLVFLDLGYALLGAFMLIASVILSLVQLVYVAQKVNPQKEVKAWLMARRSAARRGRSRSPRSRPQHDKTKRNCVEILASEGS